MNKIFLGALALTLCGGVAFAQEADTLFPELKGQFEPAPQPETVDLTVERAENDPSAQTPAQTDAKAPAQKKDEKKEKKTEKLEGKIIVQVQNVDGVLPYARTMAYCTGEMVVTNETNKFLGALSFTATYKDMPKDFSFGGIIKKRNQSKKFMLIGLPCESINGMPQFEIKSCRLRDVSEEACKKLVQFLPPGS